METAYLDRDQVITDHQEAKIEQMVAGCCGMTGPVRGFCESFSCGIVRDLLMSLREARGRVAARPDIRAVAQAGEYETELQYVACGGTYRVWFEGPEAPSEFTSELRSIEATLEETRLQFENGVMLGTKTGDRIKFYRKP